MVSDKDQIFIDNFNLINLNFVFYPNFNLKK